MNECDDSQLKAETYRLLETLDDGELVKFCNIFLQKVVAKFTPTLTRDQKINAIVYHYTLKGLSFVELKRKIEKFIEEQRLWRTQPKELRTFIPHPYPEAPNFTGRKKERAMLTKWLLEDKEHPLLSMVAIGGMGKSALTWRWLQEDIFGYEPGTSGLEPCDLKLDLDGVVWWSFYEKGMTFDSFVRSFVAKRWGKNSPMLGWALSDLYNEVYQEFQQNKYLIILDGAERLLQAYAGLGSPYQGDEIKKDDIKNYRQCINPNATTFLQHMANAITYSKTLITTSLHPNRFDKIQGCLRKTLYPLRPEDAVDFFHFEGISGTPDIIQTECDQYGYHPLTLRLLVGLINEDSEKPGNISVCSELPDISGTVIKENHIMQIAYDALDDNEKKFASTPSQK